MTKSEKRDIVGVVHYMYQRVGAKINAQILVSPTLYFVLNSPRPQGILKTSNVRGRS